MPEWDSFSQSSCSRDTVSYAIAVDGIAVSPENSLQHLYKINVAALLRLTLKFGQCLHDIVYNMCIIVHVCTVVHQLSQP